MSAVLPIVELLSTTIHSIMRQTRINAQNMIVLTVEFTRIPLSRRGKIQHWTSVSAHITLRRVKHQQSRALFTTPERQTHMPRRRDEQYFKLYSQGGWTGTAK